MARLSSTFSDLSPRSDANHSVTPTNEGEADPLKSSPRASVTKVGVDRVTQSATPTIKERAESNPAPVMVHSQQRHTVRRPVINTASVQRSDRTDAPPTSKTTTAPAPIVEYGVRMRRRQTSAAKVTSDSMTTPGATFLATPTKDIATPTGTTVQATPIKDVLALPTKDILTTNNKSRLVLPAKDILTTPGATFRATPTKDILATPTKDVTIAPPAKDIRTAPAKPMRAKPTRNILGMRTKSFPATPTKENIATPTKENIATPTKENISTNTIYFPATPTKDIISTPTKSFPATTTKENISTNTTYFPATPTKDIISTPTKSFPSKPNKENIAKPTKSFPASPSKIGVSIATKDVQKIPAPKDVLVAAGKTCVTTPPKARLNTPTKIEALPSSEPKPLARDRLSLQKKMPRPHHHDASWRRKTQPITIDEVSTANSLESVSSFRAEILERTSRSGNAFASPKICTALSDLDVAKTRPSPTPPPRGGAKGRRTAAYEHRWKTLPAIQVNVDFHLEGISEPNKTPSPLTPPLDHTVSQKDRQLVKKLDSDEEFERIVMINSRTNERFVPSAVIKGHGTGGAGGRGQGEAAEEEDSEERRHRLRHRRKKKEVTADVLKVKQEVEEAMKTVNDHYQRLEESGRLPGATPAVRPQSLPWKPTSPPRPVAPPTPPVVVATVDSDVTTTTGQEDLVRLYARETIAPVESKGMKQQRLEMAKRRATQPICSQAIESAKAMTHKADDNGCDNSKDERSSLSLADKMKMFASGDGEPKPKEIGTSWSSKRRQNPSRFQTQPITLDEVTMAGAARNVSNSGAEDEEEEPVSMKERISALRNKLDIEGVVTRRSVPPPAQRQPEKRVSGILKKERTFESRKAADRAMSTSRQNTEENDVVKQNGDGDKDSRKRASEADDTNSKSGETIVTTNGIAATTLAPETKDRKLLITESADDDDEKSLISSEISDSCYRSVEETVCEDVNRDNNNTKKQQQQHDDDVTNDTTTSRQGDSPVTPATIEHRQCKPVRRSLNNGAVLTRAQSMPLKGTGYDIDEEEEDEEEDDFEQPEVVPEGLDLPDQGAILKVSGGSIANRLASLNRNGEEAWRKKVTPTKAATAAGPGQRNLASQRLQACKDTDARPKSCLIEGDLDTLRNAALTNNNNSGGGGDGAAAGDDVASGDDDDDDKQTNSIASRLKVLQGTQTTWKNRVQTKDVEQFTMQAKMTQAAKIAGGDGFAVVRRTNISRDALRPRPHSVAIDTFKLQLTDKLSMSPRTPLANKKAATASELSSTESLTNGDTNASEVVKGSGIRLKHRPKSEFIPCMSPSFALPATFNLEPSDPVEITVPRIDEDGVISSFFKSEHTVTSDTITASVDDFNHIFIESHDMLITQRRPTPNRKPRPTSCMNPLRTLASRDDLCTSYTEHKTNIAEIEMKRTIREKVIGTKVTMAESSLAGLASSEDFSAVTLKKRATFSEPVTPGGSKWQPYNRKMLLLVKGRRRCQARLVAPQVDDNFNSGDCYVLITRKDIFAWIGKYANVLERAKVSELATYIYQYKDMGTKATQEPKILKEETASLADEFWSLIGGNPDQVKCTGGTDEDEIYESCLDRLTRVYLLTDTDTLQPLAEYSGVPLVHAMLNSKQCLVFDFGPEMYLWTGKEVPFERKKIAMSLTDDLWSQGYDYSEHDINPFAPLQEGDEVPQAAASRPSWALLGKVNENMETILFREKFTDWPDQSGGAVAVGGATSVKLVTNSNQTPAPKICTLPALSPEAISELVYADKSPVTLLLEGSDVGRGNNWESLEDGISRKFLITTLSVDTWHVASATSIPSTAAGDENAPFEGRHRLEATSSGQFHASDAYVVRWRYRKEQTGVRDLKGKEVTRKQQTGRDRCAYFFWQGSQSSITEKGASALMTVELDEERGPQIRVSQGKEPACFLNLFHRLPPQIEAKQDACVMIIHRGHRDPSLDDEETTMSSRRRLYAVAAVLQTEAHLIEITCDTSNLRSRGVYIALNARSGNAIVWYGCQSNPALRKSANSIIERLEHRIPSELRLHERAVFACVAEHEGEESNAFWIIVGGGRTKRDRASYDSLLSGAGGDLAPPPSTEPRLFSMTSVSGDFDVKEVKSQYRASGEFCAMPFEQDDLYAQTQCSISLFDCGDVVYLWCGWWPEVSEGQVKGQEDTNVTTGSARARFTSDRLTAIRTTLSYCKDKAKVTTTEMMPSYLVYAGLEPLSFTNRFLRWRLHEEAKRTNLADGRLPDDLSPLEEVLDRLQCAKYSLDRLKERPLPDGVEPLRIEYYLETSEFKDTLKMDIEEFEDLPAWKQTQLKREHGLY